MISQMNFVLPLTLMLPFVLGLLIPIFLLLVTRFSSMSGRNALQFLIAVLVSYGLWLACLLFTEKFHPGGVLEGLVGFMVIAVSALFYLEVWGLMSRGYTLGILLTLYRASGSMTAAQIASEYRGGDGLDWIVNHRIKGLEASGMLDREGNRLVLTSFPGMLVAVMYKLSINVLGLRRTG